MGNQLEGDGGNLGENDTAGPVRQKWENVRVSWGRGMQRFGSGVDGGGVKG